MKVASATKTSSVPASSAGISRRRPRAAPWRAVAALTAAARGRRRRAPRPQNSATTPPAARKTPKGSFEASPPRPRAISARPATEPAKLATTSVTTTPGDAQEGADHRQHLDVAEAHALDPAGELPEPGEQRAARRRPGARPGRRARASRRRAAVAAGDRAARPGSVRRSGSRKWSRSMPASATSSADEQRRGERVERPAEADDREGEERAGRAPRPADSAARSAPGSRGSGRRAGDQERTGRLSSARIGAPQAGQRERGVTVDSPAGRRWMTTFR